MQDVLSFLSTMERPRLLVRAARIGSQDYRRNHHLPRLLGVSNLPRPADALLRLNELEAEMNARRLNHDANYSLTRHVDLLIAIVAEAKLLQLREPQPRIASQFR